MDKAERVVSALDNYMDAKRILEINEGSDALREVRAAREELVAALHGNATIEQLRELVAIQAEDDALWAPAARIDTAYAQQALRFLTRAIEGEWTFKQARDAIQEMMP